MASEQKKKCPIDQPECPPELSAACESHDRSNRHNDGWRVTAQAEKNEHGGAGTCENGRKQSLCLHRIRGRGRQAESLPTSLADVTNPSRKSDVFRRISCGSLNAGGLQGHHRMARLHCIRSGNSGRKAYPDSNSSVRRVRSRIARWRLGYRVAARELPESD